jgi:glycosyltransferase involved in cell wall biosynthesis
MKVVVTHPGLQHADQMAVALHNAGHLVRFCSGIPLANSKWSWIARGRPKATSVPSHLLKHAPVVPVLRKIAEKVLNQDLANSASHRLDHIFDRWIASEITSIRPDMVVCYENSAQATFEAAHKVGAICILDAASIHYKTQAALNGVAAADPDWVTAQKQREINLADAILTCSPFAAGTYVKHGTDAAKIFVCPLGTDLPSVPARQRTSQGPARFIFVGALRRLKGIDILLDIFEKFARDQVPASLTLIGGAAESDLAKRAATIRSVEWRPFVPKPGLFELIAAHDCLILSSRFDSFGMVVPEAMAVGVPVIVSDRVGAKMIIEAHPGAGWITPFCRDSLENILNTLIKDRAMIDNARPFAMDAARDFQWPTYHQRVVSILTQLFEKRVR